MITSMDIKNFKCFKDFHIDLAPFNVLVGPNGSGKSTLLEAVRIAGYLGAEANHPVFLEQCDYVPIPYRRWTWMKQEDLTPTIRIYGKGGRSPDQPHQRLRSDGWVWHTCLDIEQAPVPDKKKGGWLKQQCPGWFDETVGQVAYYSLAPGDLKRPSYLKGKMSSTGAGFAGFLSHTLNNQREGFDVVEREFVRRFPEYVSVRIPSVNVAPPRRPEVRARTTGAEQEEDYRLFLRFQKRNGPDLEADDVSDGHVVSLAFMTIAHVLPIPNILLIEEPENHVHHASLKEIVGTLKGLSEDKGVQVILTTHSPYLLDSVKPEVVHVFTKDEEGAVHSARLSDHPQVETLSKHFKTGEIWTGFESDRAIVEKTGKFE